MENIYLKYLKAKGWADFAAQHSGLINCYKVKYKINPDFYFSAVHPWVVACGR